MKDIIQVILDYFKTGGVTLVRSLTLILLGYIFIQTIIRTLKRVVNKTHIDKTLPNFLISLFNIILIVILVIMILRMLNVSIDSIFTIASVITLAISLALQDILKSFANGLIIILTKPFLEGDLIEINDVQGIVYSITMFNTTLKTPDGQMIVIPNLEVTTNNVKNFSKFPIRRIDITVPISYKANYKFVNDILLQVLENHTKILKDPSPITRINDFGDSNINFLLRCYVLNENYFDVKNNLNELIYGVLKRNNISIDYNQVDVRVTKEGKL